MLKLARAITQINSWIGQAAAWLILPMFVMLVMDVAMRYLVGRPAVWTTELSQLVFGVYAVIGGGYLLVNRGHVNVDIFYGGFSVRRKAAVDVFTSVLFFLFLLVLIWQGSSMAWDSVKQMETSQSIWNPSSLAGQAGDPAGGRAAAAAGLRPTGLRHPCVDGAAERRSDLRQAGHRRIFALKGIEPSVC